MSYYCGARKYSPRVFDTFWQSFHSSRRATEGKWQVYRSGHNNFQYPFLPLKRLRISSSDLLQSKKENWMCLHSVSTPAASFCMHSFILMPNSFIHWLFIMQSRSSCRRPLHAFFPLSSSTESSISSEDMTTASI